MALMMENPLQPSISAQISKTVEDIQTCILNLRNEWLDSGLPLTDDSRVLQRFQAKLEFLLQAGLKPKSSLLGGKKSYWNYMYECIVKNKTHLDGLRYVKTLSDVKTNVGRGRALIRFCLMHCRLADTLQLCHGSDKVTREWYEPCAIWFQAQLFSPLLNALYDISEIKLDLSPCGYDLDTDWPTFARQSGVLGHHWSPPSRRGSLTSLSSFQDGSSRESSLEPSGISTPRKRGDDSISEHPDAEKMEETGIEQSDEMLGMSGSLEERPPVVGISSETLEESEKSFETCTNNTSELEEIPLDLPRLGETAMDQCEGDLAAVNIALKQQVVMLSAKLVAAEEAHAASTTLATERIQELEGALEQFNADLDELKGSPAVLGGGQAAGPSLLEVQHNKLERLNLLKMNTILQLELRSLQLQALVRVKLDAGKSSLIEAMEKKIIQQDDRNRSLIERLDTELPSQLLLQEGRLDDLLVALAASEKISQNLITVNTELRKMLTSLEEKSKKIATVAKEKVLKYVALNKELRVQLDTLTPPGMETKTDDDKVKEESLLSLQIVAAQQAELTESLRVAHANNEALSHENLELKEMLRAAGQAQEV